MSEVSDDKHQLCNHCYKCWGGVHVVRFCRKKGVTGEDSASLRIDIH